MENTAQPERPQMTLHCGDGELDVLADTIVGGESTKHPYPRLENFTIHKI
jgi:hypothetical protein